MLGLIGSPNSAAGLVEMRALLRDPDFPVSSMFLRTMSYLPLRAGDAPDVLQRQQQENMEGDRAALIAALQFKRGKALALSTETALRDVSASSPESQRKALSQQLLRNFDALSVESQAEWLYYRWDIIRDRSWLPVLEKVAAAYRDFPELREMRAYQSLQASGAALTHWYELDPKGARSAVIAEIVRPKPRYGAEVLGILKDASLPEVEPVLVANLRRADSYDIETNILSLLERYGTGGAVLELIGSRAEAIGEGACEPQSAFLGYILKFDPEAARPLIERAIQARGAASNGCRHFVFMQLASRDQSPVLEELATKSLSDPDPEVDIDAATYLGQHGSAAAEEPLWTRFMELSQKWRGREQELHLGFGATVSPNLWEANLGQALAEALAQGTGWLCDEPKLHRILDLAVGDPARSAAKSALDSASHRSVEFFAGMPDQPGWFSLAQYQRLTIEQLQTKLAQFAPSTVFRWAAGSSVPAQEEEAFRAVSDAAARAGMKIVRDSP